MMPRVLVTGASGYIGGRLVRHLEKSARWVVRAAFRHLPLDRSGESCNLDLFDPAALDAACAGVNAVIHLAALNDADCRRNPEDAFRVNCAGTHNLVAAAQRCGIKRFVYASTAHVYGAPLEGEVAEGRVPRPASLYALTHRCAEDIVLAAAPSMEGVVLRLSNGFGAPHAPGVNAWMLLANDLCRQAVERNRLVLQSPGLQWRNFVAMTDVVRGFEHAIEMPADFADGLYNLGSEQTVRVIDFCKRIQSVACTTLGKKVCIECPEAPAGASAGEAFAYSVKRFKASGFQPVGNVDDELAELLRFCVTHFGKR